MTASAPTAGRKAPACPICGKPRHPDFRPFCSKRCRQVDLSRWMNEVYAVPAAEPGEEEEDEDGLGAPRSG